MSSPKHSRTIYRRAPHLNILHGIRLNQLWLGGEIQLYAHRLCHVSSCFNVQTELHPTFLHRRIAGSLADAANATRGAAQMATDCDTKAADCCKPSIKPDTSSNNASSWHFVMSPPIPKRNGEHRQRTRSAPPTATPQAWQQYGYCPPPDPVVLHPPNGFAYYVGWVRLNMHGRRRHASLATHGCAPGVRVGWLLDRWLDWFTDMRHN